MSEQTHRENGRFRDHPLSPKTYTQIVLDTNFIISLLKQHRDLEAEVKIAVPGPVKIVVLDLVLLELERLSRKGSAKVRTWANVAIDYLGKRNYPIIEHRPGPTDVDVSLVESAFAEKTSTAIATIDGELRKALESLGIPAIWPKARFGLITERLRL